MRCIFLATVYHRKHMSAENKKTVQPASVSIGSKIAAAEAAQVRVLIEAGVYLNESDFVRDAIRHRLFRD